MSSTSEPKTVPTGASVKAFIAAQPDAQRRADCQALAKLMEAATGEKARMWGDAIIGFGNYRLAYANGRSALWPVAAFSPRKNDLTLYIGASFARREELLARLGKHKTGKVCVYIKRLADVDAEVLADLVQASVDTMAPQRVMPGETA
jgi:hypothetical protein